MPVIANTPEALIARTDSCDPETTCQGLTNSGKPCRRALGDPTDRYCWQHKDQAATESPGTSTPSAMNPNKPRTSIDTLLDRIGILNINDGASEKWRPSRPTTSNKPQKRQKKRTICCCFEVIEEEEIRPPRPVSARPPSQAAAPGAVPQANLLSPNSQIPTRPSAHTSSHYSSTSSGIPESWIPADLSAEATSTLASELDKPISERDEPGYIYMFWLTPEETTGNGGGARGPPPAEVASSLLPHHHKSSGGGARDRAVSDAIRTARDLRALTSAPSATSPGTIRLKIGRANNVQRRMNEWSRQCGHHVTLIRYYPYTPSTPQPSPARVGGGTVHDNDALEPGRKVPFVHRVERLIHLELGDVRIRDMGKCPECGREHKEWFEVTAEKSSLKRVDDCIRRWVKWAEMQEKQSR
ncbi:hypothetical protein ASPACDRAFT_36770 [Aspergillus aculeatus ATCC 16872]|uniref:Bacteriophage T5 Orf172 DNA-binding domain-containing protein n=1 Tax=Aspergillus aculeatus (strain ATCC 16872 / CBS 172.66 / WB 5094) TaxID=690307 RepID=A0A1L9WGK7_ASPA1|nr:uncharacterized protein ASPACDRAFT_36770 [Aspergillus aculeatus ATCC 16872]OJJ95302.1 hypothetical protein ASPACDRAFT_36770 [Aspergillus aculeatus ATCC 16872]